MIHSMTGYSRLTRQTRLGPVTVEVRSTNHRYLEIGQRLPDGLTGVDGEVTQLVRRAIRRGRVEVLVALQSTRRATKRVTVDEALARTYCQRLRAIKRRLGLAGAVELSHVLALPHVIHVADDTTSPQAAWPAIRQTIEASVRRLSVMRAQEGRRLARDLRALAQGIERSAGAIRKRVPQAVAQQRLRLQQRLKGAFSASTLTSAQLQEAVACVREVDVHEELVRLSSHLVHLRQALNGREAMGKKLDFIAQELMREANTIGSKANDADIARHVIEIKQAIEKIREQAQNLE
jgi:uncharacterized protein (TIGR00255 family)